ncbi:hypothetical protein GQ55_9G640600 [Panicum hallii var. hallii]|uniref:Uncharacterized protein n=1 Tax=Panicum hallii var. hallii TaxID=1504633 RepID=A0A2T7CIJ3_9POAL|nr:hypothetical protein GQ55_9G640600 [Panicum hallii var. hallii]
MGVRQYGDERAAAFMRCCRALPGAGTGGRQRCAAGEETGGGLHAVLPRIAGHGRAGIVAARPGKERTAARATSTGTG